MSGRLRLRLESHESALKELERSIEEFASQQGWTQKLKFQMQLALEEVVLNVINHGFGEEGHHFEVEIESSPSTVRFEVSDTARPYNPLVESAAPDLDAKLEDRAVGGLGVHMIRTIADQLHYERDGNRNRFRFVKARNE